MPCPEPQGEAPRALAALEHQARGGPPTTLAHSRRRPIDGLVRPPPRQTDSAHGDARLGVRAKHPRCTTPRYRSTFSADWRDEALKTALSRPPATRGRA